MKISKNELQKKRTQGTVEMITAITQRLDIDALMSDIFIWTENLIAQKMIKMYESQLILACLRPKEFGNQLHGFYKETANYIVENNLKKEFLSFVYFIFSSIKNKENLMNEDSLNCYLDILLQQFDYFIEHPNFIYGLDNDGNWLTTTEPFPNIDVAYMEGTETLKNASFDLLYKNYIKYGYDVKSNKDVKSMHFNDQLLTNMLLIMSNFMNEQTNEILPTDYYLVANGFDTPKRAMPTDYYKKLLQKKRYFLPNSGVKGVYKRALDIESVYFQETFTDNRIVLLYKITAKNGKEFSGFYDNKAELFFSPWEGTDNKIARNYTENFILESYCYLTTNIEELENDDGFKRRLFIENESEDTSDKSLISVRFFYNTKSDSNKTDKDSIQPFEKNKYQEVMRHINPMIRKLPAGAVASEEAKQLAREYNYVIREGETFVRPFTRKVYVKDNK